MNNKIKKVGISLLAVSIMLLSFTAASFAEDNSKICIIQGSGGISI